MATRGLPTWLAVILVVGAGLVFVPFGPWIALAVWLGLYARRIHAPLTRRLGGRTRLSATVTLSLLLVVIAPIAFVVVSIGVDAIALVENVVASDRARGVFVRLVSAGHSNELGTPVATTSGVVDLILAQGDRALAIVQSVAGIAARLVLGVLVMVVGMYGVLVDGERWYAWLVRHAPIAPAHVDRLAQAFVETGRGLWWGIVGAGTLQSIVATIAYLALGVPSAFALGLLTLVFSVIPAIGTAIVWVPVAAGLALTGRPVAAVVLAVIGVAVIGTVDNLARPYLTHRGKLELPTWVVLTSMFGGVELFGGWGLVIGPLVVRLAKEALVIGREARDPATSGPSVETPDTP